MPRKGKGPEDIPMISQLERTPRKGAKKPVQGDFSSCERVAFLGKMSGPFGKRFGECNAGWPELKGTVGREREWSGLYFTCRLSPQITYA